MLRKVVISLAVLLLFALQYILWFGAGGLVSMMQLRALIAEQSYANHVALQRNQQLTAEITALHHDPQAVESLARSELGMVMPGETLYRIV